MLQPSRLVLRSLSKGVKRKLTPMSPRPSHIADPGAGKVQSDAVEGGTLPSTLVDLAPSNRPEATDLPLSEAASIAATIQRAGMAGPASVALRVVKPLSWIGGQIVWVLQPFIEGLGLGNAKEKRGQSPTGVSRVATFLEGEGNVADLLAHLEGDTSGKQRAPRRRENGRD